jgi:hypothetical protein
MKRGVLGWLVGIFLLAAMALLVGFNLTKSRILVLHSGQRSSGWNLRIDEGIRAALDRNRRPVTVHWYYLGLERSPLKTGWQDAATQARRAIEQLRPHVLLAMDDEAQAYVARHYAVPAGSAQAAEPRTRIVYVAIVSQPASYGYDTAANVSGVLERLPLAAMRETLLTLRNGQPARLAVIGSADPTGFAEMHQVQAFDWSPHRLVAAQVLADFAAWQQTIPRLDSLADVLIVLSFGGLPQGGGVSRPTTVEEVASWIETHAQGAADRRRHHLCRRRWWLGYRALAARDGRSRHADEPRMAARRGHRSTGCAASGHRQALPRGGARVGAAGPRRSPGVDLPRGSPSRPKQLPLNAGGRGARVAESLCFDLAADFPYNILIFKEEVARQA